ncbi:hypothetical protein CK203_054787 [Vitis vinifera]|uniref:Uncharacterized protein n=1 Tax=Vitis vinifera TaxID=29760 RepID=A0A438GIP9_VITVI|nr:hypothetical protein CK203_054787 [Vitis vinifera]
MGDLMGSPRVAPLFHFSDVISMIYVRIVMSIFPSEPADHRSDPLIIRYQSSKSTVVDLSSLLPRESCPHFSTIGVDANLCQALSPIHDQTLTHAPKCESNSTDQNMVLILRGVHRPIWTNILRYSHNNTSVKTNFSPYFLLSSTPEVAPQSYHIRRLGCNNMTGANIPTLKHQIPSELYRKACLGENSTRMGDLLGSPCVAPLLPFF